MASHPVFGGRNRGPAELLHRCFARLVDPEGDGSILFAPLVIVAADRTPASVCLTGVLDATAAAAAVDRIAVWDGPTLGRSLDASGVDRLHRELARHRLVVVDHADEVGGRARQRGLATLLDALHASGTATCVSLAAHPMLARSLEPRLVSRLTAGLLVVLPDAPPEPDPAAAAAPRRPARLSRIFATVARQQECSLADLYGPSRCRAIAAARSLAMYVARVVTHSSFHAIGAACGGRDHTTAMHAMKVVGRRMAGDTAFAAEVGRIVRRLAAPAAMARRR